MVRASVNAAIVIPVLNQLHYTRSCLSSLGGEVTAGVPIVVVDNGSNDGTAEFLAAQQGITVVRNAENLGCAAAWNQGVNATTAEWVVLLNNDVLVTEGWLSGLLTFAQRLHADLISPAFREGELNYELAPYAREFVARMRNVTRWGTANGICFMVRRRVFETIGGFDENFRIGQFEDSDFFLRARQAGFRSATTGAAFIHHFGSVTQNAVRRDNRERPYEAENRAYFRKKWRLGWWRRRLLRVRTALRTAWWRWTERRQHGHTLYEKWLSGRLRFH